jgi:hypothetical protein
MSRRGPRSPAKMAWAISRLRGKGDGRIYLRRVRKFPMVLLFPRFRCYPKSLALLSAEFGASGFPGLTLMA